MKNLRRTLSVVTGLVAALWLAPSAQALPYFDALAGFANSTSMLPSEYVISLDASFPALDIELVIDEVANETFGEPIDRTITWTLINHAEIPEFVVFFTTLAPMGPDYSGDNIDIEIDGVNPMQIMEFGAYFFAGYYLNLADFALVVGRLETKRTFCYTVDVPLQGGMPPALGIVLTSEFSVPEPATGLLLASALLLMVAVRGRRNRS